MLTVTLVRALVHGSQQERRLQARRGLQVPHAEGNKNRCVVFPRLRSYVRLTKPHFAQVARTYTEGKRGRTSSPSGLVKMATCCLVYHVVCATVFATWSYGPNVTSRNTFSFNSHFVCSLIVLVLYVIPKRDRTEPLLPPVGYVVCAPEQTKKVYQGTSVFAEHPLLEEPSGLCCFQGEGDDTRRPPAVAVAAGPYIFIYK